MFTPSCLATATSESEDFVVVELVVLGDARNEGADVDESIVC